MYNTFLMRSYIFHETEITPIDIHVERNSVIFFAQGCTAD